MLSDNFFPFLIGSVRVIVIHAYIICAKGTMIIGVRFRVGNGIKMNKYVPRASLQRSQQKLILLRIIRFWLRERYPVFIHSRKTQPKVVSLNLVVFGPIFNRLPVANSRKQTTGGISVKMVRINSIYELVFECFGYLYTV